MARQRRPLMTAVDHEIMALWLAGDRFADRRIEQIVAFRGAQWRTQIGCVIMTEAHIERAGACDAHPIARFAKIVSQWRDKAESTAGLFDADVTRRSAGAVVDVLQRIA